MPLPMIRRPPERMTPDVTPADQEPYCPQGQPQKLANLAGTRVSSNVTESGFAVLLNLLTQHSARTEGGAVKR